MSINRFADHVFILPEDDANRQLANGFLLNVHVTTQIHILKEVGGWARVRDCFASDHLGGMRRFGRRFMVLLVDFDNDINRREAIKATIPEDLVDRVFVLGAWGEPEELRRAGLGTFEEVGKALAEDCRSGSQGIWEHHLLQHNKDELERLREAACNAIFHLQNLRR